QSREIGQRTAELPEVGVAEGAELFVRGSLVHVRDDLPVALEDVPWDERHGHQIEAGHVHAVDHAAIEVVPDDRLTLAAVGILADPARAGRRAGARRTGRAPAP